MEPLEFNDREIEALYAAVGSRLEDMTGVTQEIGEALVTSTEARFAQSVDPEGRPWAPKSDATLAKYGVLGGNSLRQPLIGPSRTLSTTIFYEADQDAVMIASNAIQAAVMQFGAQKGEFGPRTPWGDIPARPFLGVSSSDHNMIRETLTDYLQRGIE